MPELMNVWMMGLARKLYVASHNGRSKGGIFATKPLGVFAQFHGRREGREVLLQLNGGGKGSDTSAVKKKKRSELKGGT